MLHTKNAASKARAIFLTISLLNMLFVGITYSWSLFLGHLEADLRWSRDVLTVAYSINQVTYCFGNIFASLLVRKLDYRKVMFIGGAMWGIGYCFTSRATSPIQMYFFYGILCGVANGMLFNNTVNSILLFFDERVNTITGILMLLLGMSNMLLGPAITLGLQGIGWRGVFLIIGMVSCIFCCLGAAISPAGLIAPAAKKTPAAASALGVLKRRNFWILFFWSMITCMIGQSYIGQAAACGSDIGATVAQTTLLVAILSAFNGLGRLLFGRFYDIYKKKTNLHILNCVFLLGCMLLAMGCARRALPLLFAGTALLGLGYGGQMISRTATMRAYFGAQNYSMNLSLINLSIIPSGSAGLFLVTSIHGFFNDYTQVFLAFAAITVITFILTCCLPEAAEPPKGA